MAPNAEETENKKALEKAMAFEDVEVPSTADELVDGLEQYNEAIKVLAKEAVSSYKNILEAKGTGVPRAELDQLTDKFNEHANKATDVSSAYTQYYAAHKDIVTGDITADRRSKIDEFGNYDDSLDIGLHLETGTFDRAAAQKLVAKEELSEVNFKIRALTEMAYTAMINAGATPDSARLLIASYSDPKVATEVAADAAAAAKAGAAPAAVAVDRRLACVANDPGVAQDAALRTAAGAKVWVVGTALERKAKGVAETVFGLVHQLEKAKKGWEEAVEGAAELAEAGPKKKAAVAKKAEKKVRGRRAEDGESESESESETEGEGAGAAAQKGKKRGREEDGEGEQVEEPVKKARNGRGAARKKAVEEDEDDEGEGEEETGAARGGRGRGALPAKPQGEVTRVAGAKARFDQKMEL
jgi:hypothetical protein